VRSSDTAADKNVPSSTGAKEYVIDFLPKVKLEIIVIDEIATLVAETIERAVRTGPKVDIRILVMPIDDAIRIRTGKRGANAL
jgi:nitrogen regulatory protein P-II 1